ncbi:MAG: DUF2169 domain-containing protein [Gemmatimonadetes bacterium]|nr:DUF2169 domain-containing protein [Gemmatimonadota bacterium]
MQLINTTPVPTKLAIYAPPAGLRTAIFTAKATFRVSDAGEVTLDREEPLPVLDADEPTELGLLPSDALPRCDAAFEVMLLGKAYAPNGVPTPYLMVSLAVGAIERRLAVLGDRRWEGEGPGARISAPQPFVCMPLTWTRAFGGRKEVLIDVESPIEVVEANNPDGKGFDHIGQGRQAAAVFKPPAPFPQFDTVRELPNLEDPLHPILGWDDRPLPACWAPTPLHYGMLYERLRRARQAHPDQPVTMGSPEIMHRAHPDWTIELPPARTPVRLLGATPNGAFGFVIPALRMLIDVRAGDHQHELELVPRALVLLPEQRRFYLVYRQYTTFEYQADQVRAARVRAGPGWARA